MPLSVLVRTYTGEILRTSVNREIGSVCSAAREADMPFLGSVDPYDNTVFNRSQVARIQAELEAVRGAVTVEDPAAINEIADLIDMVLARPHRYLVFSGD